MHNLKLKLKRVSKEQPYFDLKEIWSSEVNCKLGLKGIKLWLIDKLRKKIKVIKIAGGRSCKFVSLKWECVNLYNNN